MRAPTAVHQCGLSLVVIHQHELARQRAREHTAVRQGTAAEKEGRGFVSKTEEQFFLAAAQDIKRLV